MSAALHTLYPQRDLRSFSNSARAFLSSPSLAALIEPSDIGELLSLVAACLDPILAILLTHLSVATFRSFSYSSN